MGKSKLDQLFELFQTWRQKYVGVYIPALVLCADGSGGIQVGSNSIIKWGNTSDGVEKVRRMVETIRKR